MSLSLYFQKMGSEPAHDDDTKTKNARLMDELDQLDLDGLRQVKAHVTSLLFRKEELLHDTIKNAPSSVAGVVSPRPAAHSTQGRTG